MSISKNDIKFIKSLERKKFRQQHQLFKVEGVKGIAEFLDSKYEVQEIYAIEKLFEHSFIEISTGTLSKISALKTPNKAVALFKIPRYDVMEKEDLTVVLDDVRDPGNLGTIIRLCDWFGVSQLLCSQETVDCYNPKVVQATMGSLSRINIHYLDLYDYLSQRSDNIFGTYMDGRPIYDEILPSAGYIVFGNEANGISTKMEKVINRKLSIPAYGNTGSTESLNVATAAAIVLNEFRRGG